MSPKCPFFSPFSVDKTSGAQKQVSVHPHALK